MLQVIEDASGKKLTQRKRKNASSVAIALEEFGPALGLLKPHREAQYLAQLAHESMGFQYDREIWGPTAAQKRYEGRKDLGNIHKGDGKKFAGHGPIQVTGRYNHCGFRDWCRKMFPDSNVPDFEKHPTKINTDPWEGLTGIWYWETRNLNKYADRGDVEMITKKINGGLNGYGDRVDWLVKFSLVMLGYDKDDVRAFQQNADIAVDGIAGPQTRAKLHETLVDLGSKKPKPTPKPIPKPTPKPKPPRKSRKGLMLAILILVIGAVIAGVFMS